MTDRVSSSGKRVCWAIAVGALIALAPVASVQAQIQQWVTEGDGEALWAAGGSFSPTLPDDPEGGAQPWFLTHPRYVPTSIVDEHTIGQQQWGIYSMHFIPDVDNQSMTITGNPLYLGAGGIHNQSVTQFIENDILLWDNTTIDGGGRLELTGDGEIRLDGSGGPRTLRLEGLVYIGGLESVTEFVDEETGFVTTYEAYGPTIRGDGDVVIAGEIVMPNANDYRGTTYFDEGQVIINADDAFGDSDNWLVIEGTTNRISAWDQSLTLSQRIELRGDLSLGGPSVWTNPESTGGPITLTGVIDVIGDDRVITTETDTTHTIDGSRIDLNDNDLTFYQFGRSQLTVHNLIDGTGGIIKDGSGTLTLQGENDYSGDTIFRDGTIELGGLEVLGFSEHIVVEGRTFMRALQPITFNQTWDFGSSLEFLDGEAVVFDAPITFTGDAEWRMRNSDEVTLVTENADIELDANWTIRDAGDLTIESDITGEGNLTKRGTGVLTLEGENTFEGDTSILDEATVILSSGATLGHEDHTTTVEEATLYLNEDSMLEGALEIDRFGVVEAMGDLGGDLTVDRRGYIRLGDEIRTLSIGGDATFAGGVEAGRGIVKYTTESGESDHYVVDGTATFEQGGHLSMEQVGGGFVRGGQEYFLLQAGNLVLPTNPDDAVLGQSLFMQFSVDTTAAAANELRVEANREPFESAATGSNNVTLSQALDRIVQHEHSFGEETVELLVALDNSADVEVFNENLRQLSPTTYTGGVDATVQGGRSFHQNVHTQARTTREARRMGVGYNAASSFAQNLGPTPWAMASAQPYLWDDTYRDRLEDRPESSRRRWGEAPRRDRRDDLRRHAVNENRWNVFANTYGAHERIDSEADRPGLRANTGGFAVGADYSFTENFYLGGSAGYAYTDVTFRENRGDGTVHSFRAGPYLGWTVGDFTLDASATYGYHQNDYDQNVNINGLSQEKNADFDSHDLSAYVNLGYEFMMPNQRTSFTPVASMNYTHYRRDSFTETGGGATNFDVDSQTVDFMEGTIGIRFEHRYRTDGTAIIPHAFLGYSYEFLGDDNDVETRFAGTNESFTLNGPEPDRHALRVGAGLRALLSDTVQGYLQYNGRFQSDQSGHAGIVGLSFQF